MFYPKIGDYVLLRNGKVAKIAQKLVFAFVDVFSIEVLPDFRSETCSKEFIVKTFPPVDLHTLKAGDMVELANGETKKVRSVKYSPSEKNVQVVFTTCKSTLPWNYQRDGAGPYFPMDSIVKIIPKLKNAVDLTTLKEGDTVHLSNRQSAKVVSIASKMLGTIYLIRLRGFRPNYYCVDGCSLDKIEPSITKIVPKPSATYMSTTKKRGAVITFARPKISFSIDPAVTKESFYDALRESTLFAGSTPLGISQFVNSLFDVDLTTLQPGDTVELVNGKTKEVLKVDLQSRAHASHICITFADGVWIYNSDGTRPPGRDSAYNIVKITPKTKPTPLTVNGHVVKSGDRLRFRNGTVNTVKNVTWNECDDNWTVAYGGQLAGFLRNFSYYSSGKNPFNSEFDITAVVNEPTPLTIGGHVVKPGDVLTRANGDQIVVDKITPALSGNWKVWHSYGGCFGVDSSGRCISPGLTITAVVPNQTIPQNQSGVRATLTPWPKPITTPPTKKDADSIDQVAVLDRDTDWMKQQWWDARDMLAAGKITGWAHTQAWHDAKNKPLDHWY